MKKIFQAIAAVAMIAAGLFTSAASASDVLLKVSGKVENAAGRVEIALGRPELEAMPRSSFRTTTIWTEGEHEFTGVALRDLLAAIGANGSALRAVALNDYSVMIPVSDALEGGPIVAYLMDGKEMSVRDKGPLWIVYPYDRNANYRTETVYSRSIWQLARLEVVD